MKNIWIQSALIFMGMIAPIATGVSAQVQTMQIANQNNWRQIKNMAGNCQVAFPEDPQHMHQKMPMPEAGGQLNYHVYVAGLEQDAVYMVLVAEYPTHLDPNVAELSLEQFLNGILNQNPSNQLVFADIIEVNGNKGMDFAIKTQGTLFKGRAILSQNKLYLLAMECEPQNYQDADFSYFISSFTLVKN